MQRAGDSAGSSNEKDAARATDLRLVAFMSQTPELRQSALIDTHTHVHFQGLQQTVDALSTHFRDNARQLQLVVMSTCCAAGRPHPVANEHQEKGLAFRPPQDDWKVVAQLARTFPRHVVPAFGIHPWYADVVADEAEVELVQGDATHSAAAAENHEVGDGCESQGKERTAQWLQELERLLVEFPHAVVGEVGLDKLKGGVGLAQEREGAAVSKSATSKERLRLQSLVLKQQLDVATRLGGRSVSVHCVQATGPLFDILRLYPQTVQSKWTASEGVSHSSNPGSGARTEGQEVEPVVLRIALHSFSGSSDFVRSLLALEKKRQRPGGGKKRQRKRRQCKADASSTNSDAVHEEIVQVAETKRPVHFEFYFGFSMSVNCGCVQRLSSLANADAKSSSSPRPDESSCREIKFLEKKKAKLASIIRSIPPDRILLETDRGAFGSEVCDDLEHLCEVCRQIVLFGRCVATYMCCCVLLFLRLRTCSTSQVIASCSQDTESSVSVCNRARRNAARFLRWQASTDTPHSNGAGNIDEEELSQN